MFITMHITHNVLPNIIKHPKGLLLKVAKQRQYRLQHKFIHLDKEPLISNEENPHIGCKFVQVIFTIQNSEITLLF